MVYLLSQLRDGESICPGILQKEKEGKDVNLPLEAVLLPVGVVECQEPVDLEAQVEEKVLMPQL